MKLLTETNETINEVMQKNYNACYVITEYFGRYKLTTLSNYASIVRNSRLMITIEAESLEEAIEIAKQQAENSGKYLILG